MVAERYSLLPRPVSPPPALGSVTAAEQEMLSYVCAGYSNKGIAAFLGKADPTVKHQVSACQRKGSGSADAARVFRAGGARNGPSSRM